MHVCASNTAFVCEFALQAIEFFFAPGNERQVIPILCQAARQLSTESVGGAEDESAAAGNKRGGKSRLG
jgi:hypothetical protein